MSHIKGMMPYGGRNDYYSMNDTAYAYESWVASQFVRFSGLCGCRLRSLLDTLTY